MVALLVTPAFGQWTEAFVYGDGALVGNEPPAGGVWSPSDVPATAFAVSSETCVINSGGGSYNVWNTGADTPGIGVTVLTFDVKGMASSQGYWWYIFIGDRDDDGSSFGGRAWFYGFWYGMGGVFGSRQDSDVVYNDISDGFWHNIKAEIDFELGQTRFWFDGVQNHTVDHIAPTAALEPGIGFMQFYHFDRPDIVGEFINLDNFSIDREPIACGAEVTPGTLNSVALSGGPANPSSHVYTVENISNQADLGWSVGVTDPDSILSSVVPASGTLPAFHDTDTLTATVSPGALGDGRYSALLTFTDDCSTVPFATRGVQLAVGSKPCLLDMFAYGDGDLDGNANEADMWYGGEGYILTEGQQAKIDTLGDGTGIQTCSMDGLSCGPCEDGIIKVSVDVKAAAGNTGNSNIWQVTFQDTRGINLAQFYGTETTVHGEVAGGAGAETAPTNLTVGSYDTLSAVIDTVNNITTFYINGSYIDPSMPSISHGVDHHTAQANVGDAVGEVSIFTFNRDDTNAGTIYFDNLQVIGCDDSCYMEVERRGLSRFHYIVTGDELEGQPADQDYTVSNEGLEEITYSFAECLEDGDTLGGTVDYPWLSLALASGADGTLAAGESEEVDVTYSTTGLTTGQYVAYLKFSNDCASVMSYIRAIKVTVDDPLHEDFSYLDGRLLDKPTWENDDNSPIGIIPHPIQVANGRLHIAGNIEGVNISEVHSRLLNNTSCPPEGGLKIISFKIWGGEGVSRFAEIYVTPHGKRKDDSVAGWRIMGSNIEFQANGGWIIMPLTGGGTPDVIEARVNNNAFDVLGIPFDTTRYYMNGVEIGDWFIIGNPRFVLIEQYSNAMDPIDDPDPVVEIDDLIVTPCTYPCNDPFADADGDGDTDQDDFALFQLCYSGTNVAFPAGLDCACFDRGSDAPAGDGDIDSFDYDEFKDCASGPNIPVTPVSNPNCDFN
jgi:hypothetical protein